MHIVIADPSEVYRLGVKSLVSGLDSVEIVGEAGDMEVFEGILVEANSVGLVMLDPSIARSIDDRVSIFERVRGLAPDVRVVVVADAPVEHMRRAIELGVHACLTKTAGAQELAAALRVVARGGRYIQSDLLGPLLDGAFHGEHAPRLSTSQMVILQLVSRGHKNQRIANELGMSVTALKSHLRLIYSQLAASNRVEAVAIAVRLGVIS